jgi:NAD(P)-dependent dehydrogenase (short-subunit alcohol dehydrogenase family)
MIPQMLANKVAIVTGAGGALGAGIARGLAQEGAAVVLADVKVEATEEVAAQIRAEGGRALVVVCDISQSAAVAGMVRQATSSYGGVDILVNNAAIYPRRAWTEISEHEWDDVFAVNMKGYYLCARSVYPSMKARGGGKIVNISSITFFLGQWGMLLSYVSSKGAIVGFTRALAREVGADGINVNCIAPGAFPTDAERIHPNPEGYEAFILQNQTIQRRGRPEDIANAVLFFASHLSDFVTGQSLLVDGGWMTH